MPSPEGAREGERDGQEPGWASSAEEHSASEPLSKGLLLVPALQPGEGTLGSAGFPTAPLLPGQ